MFDGHLLWQKLNTHLNFEAKDLAVQCLIIMHPDFSRTNYLQRPIMTPECKLVGCYCCWHKTVYWTPFKEFQSGECISVKNSQNWNGSSLFCWSINLWELHHSLFQVSRSLIIHPYYNNTAWWQLLKSGLQNSGHTTSSCLTSADMI